MDPRQWLTILHPEFLLFEAMIHETDFMPSEDVPEPVLEALDRIPGEVIGLLRDATAQLPLIRFALEHGWELSRIEAEGGRKGVAPSELFKLARDYLVDAMRQFHEASAPVPSALRPILWRWLWDAEEPPLQDLVPGWFHPHMARTLRYSSTPWEHGRIEHMFLWYDPRKVVRKDLEAVQRSYRKAHPKMPARAGFSLERSWVEQQTMLWPRLVRLADLDSRFGDVIPFPSDLRDTFVEAFNRFVGGDSVEPLAGFLIDNRDVALDGARHADDGPFSYDTVCDYLRAMRRDAQASSPRWFAPIPTERPGQED